jgi:hypothetical protein
MRSFAAVASLLALAAPSQARQPAPQPDAWRLIQTPQYCSLARSIGEGADKADVFIQSFGSNSVYHVLVRSAALPLRAQRSAVAQVGFGGANDPKEAFIILGKTGAGVATAVFAANPPRQVEMGGAFYLGKGTDAHTTVPIDTTGETLTIDMEGMGTLAIPLGSMAGEYARLDACVEGLEAGWRTAASAGALAVSGPKMLHPGETNWHLKYPENLLLNRISGFAELYVTVDAKGRARDCVIQLSTWAPDFGDKSCSAMKTIARFEPARDSQGNPVSALYRTSLMFVIYDW